MIDPKITVANTKTLIRRAMAEKRENHLKTFADVIAMPGWRDLLEGLQEYQKGLQELEVVKPSKET